LNPFRKIRSFYVETVIELKRATWPTPPELRESTVVVIAGVAVLGFFISVADFSLSESVELVTILIRG
jgi:preprotein translocase subunit SecE|tara:strand:- start:4218 stop:4421 length:204 start_codon:yes stop_codon:yes gene_type:complete